MERSMSREERFMEDVSRSPEAVVFNDIQCKLHDRIVSLAREHGYNLAEAVRLLIHGDTIVQEGFVAIPVTETHLLDSEQCERFPFGMPDSVALYLIAKQCGVVFPQLPETTEAVG